MANPVTDPLQSRPDKVWQILLERNPGRTECILKLADISDYVITHIPDTDATFANREKIEQNFVGPIEIAAVVVQRNRRLRPTLIGVELMDQIIRTDMCNQNISIGTRERAQTVHPFCATRKLGTQVGIQNQHVRLVDRYVVADWRKPVPVG
jgi:endoglucanase Acf2